MEKKKEPKFMIEQLIKGVMNKGDVNAKAQKEVMDALNKEIREKPFKVAVIGKSGVGKTSILENCFGATGNASNRISTIGEGTTEIEERIYPIEDGFTLSIADMPGLRNDITKDEKVYIPLYKSILPGCDVIVYVIDASAKTIGSDIKILRDTVIPICTEAKNDANIIIVLNKIDTIGETFPEALTDPDYHWDEKDNKPTDKLKEIIANKINVINMQLIKHDIVKCEKEDSGVDMEKIVIMSAIYAYNMRGFLDAILETKRGIFFVATVAQKIMKNPSDFRMNQ